jgi:hypothetical protein
VSTDLFRRYGNLLRPDGTNQLQRLLPGLEADYILPDERSLAELLDYAYRIAAEVRYFDLTGQATGDWRPLLESLLVPGTDRVRPTAELQTLLASRSDWPPHLVLFLAFLKLFQNLQGDLNQLPRKHLLHYYEKHLGLMRRPAANDAAHVLFELAPNAPAVLLPAGTLLDAGKDALGRPLTYATQNELVVSNAVVSGISRIVVQRDPRQFRRFFVANSIAEHEAPGFATFGSAQLELDATRRFMHEAPLGFTVAAPILQLAEGQRTITLRAHLRPPTGAPALVTQGISEAVEVSVTGAKGWLTPDNFTATLLEDGGLGQPALLLSMSVSAEAPAIIAADPAQHGAELSGQRAAVRCLVKGAAGGYELLDGFTVDRIDIDVTVQGVRTLVVQNDESTLVTGKPIPLFGSQPRIGSAFYIGSAEVFSKRLTGLDIRYEWKAPPENLFEHYRAYFDSINNQLSDAFHAYFRVGVDLLYDRVFRPLSTDGLFTATPSEPTTISVSGFALSTIAGYAEQADLEQPEVFDGSSRFGFVRLSLQNPKRSEMLLYSSKAPFEAFGHSIFPARYAVRAIELSNTPGGEPNFPKDPYTPMWTSLSLDYSANAQIQTSAVPANSGYFMVGPFGARRADTSSEARLVPAIDGTASLFLGVTNLNAPANLSMLFDIDAGTATDAQVLREGETEWSYLDAQDLWQPLASSAILTDGTQGFQSPGVIAIAVPREAALEHRSMPAGQVWLRALLRRPPESAARTLSIKAQAALAVFAPGQLPLTDFAEHLRSPLPPRTITNLVSRNANIKVVEQPGASFGGRGSEEQADFIRRNSERLRHRNRAVTPWDLERLVLERFPEVFKVKSLAHADETGSRRAGHTALVVVPNLRDGEGTNPLEPRAGETLLTRIDDYVRGLVTPFADLHVIRPAFERVRVEAKVVFARGRDPGYFAARLNEDLRRFLSPWAYEEGEDILFGTRLYRSEILAFIESRDYVEHIIGLRMYHRHAGDMHDGIGSMIIDFDFIVHPTPRPTLGEMSIGDDFIVGRPFEAATTTEPHAILVSHPAHLITPVAHGAEICSGVTQLGIGLMTVGLDFEVGLEDV